MKTKKNPCMILYSPIFPQPDSDSNMGSTSEAFANFLWNLEEMKPQAPPPRIPPVISLNLPDNWGVKLPPLLEPPVYANITETAT